MIKKTHMATNTGSSPLDMDRARSDFIQMKQQRGETIHSYRLRLEDNVARMKALKCNWIPDEGEQVMQFIQGLLSKYAAYAADFHNKLIMDPGDIPTDLATAEHEADHFRSERGMSDHESELGDVLHTKSIDKAVQKALKNVTLESVDDSTQHAVAMRISSFRGRGRGNGGRNGRGRGGRGERDYSAGQRTQSKTREDKRTHEHSKKQEYLSDDDEPAGGKSKCPLCPPPGASHDLADCPLVQDAQKLAREGKLKRAFVIFSSYCANGEPLPTSDPPTPAGITAAVSSPLGQYDVLLDNQSNINIFAEGNLLRDIESADRFDIGGITDGPKLSARHLGRCAGPDFGPIHFAPGATANVLSFKRVADRYKVTWDQEKRTFTVIIPGYSRDRFVFREMHDGLYVCDFSFLLHKGTKQNKTAVTFGPQTAKQHARDVRVATTKQNESQYSRSEVVRARLARKLLRSLSYPPAQVAARMVNQGALVDCPITSQDIVNASKIYGYLAIPELRGKHVRSRGFDTVSIEPGIRVRHAPVYMYTDVMYVTGQAFLLSLWLPINLVAVNHIPINRKQGQSKPTGGEIRKALEEQLNKLEGKHIHILACYADNEIGREGPPVATHTTKMKMRMPKKRKRSLRIIL